MARDNGVRVHGQSRRGSWFIPVTGRDADWQLFEWDTWQFRRSIFDKMMLDEAVARGAEVMAGKAERPLLTDAGIVRGVRVRPAGGDGTLDLETEMLLDCSGQATWLANLGGVTGPKYLGSYDKQIAIFSQVSGAIRDDGPTRDLHRDNTHIFYQKKYHWSWFIPLDQDVVSVGAVCPSAYYLSKKETLREYLLREMRELHPDLARRVGEPKLVEDVHVIPNYSYQVRNFTGRGFICIGDAHRFIDPIFSFGTAARGRSGATNRASSPGRAGRTLDDLAASYLHMHANRLLRSAQRHQELVLYDLLLRIYDSKWRALARLWSVREWV